MAQSAMSGTIWNGKWEPLSYKSDGDEWLLIKDELENKEVNDPSFTLTKHEIAEQLLNDIEDLGKNIETDDWLDEFPLFEEIQTLTPTEDIQVSKEDESGNYYLKVEQEHCFPKYGSAVPEIQKQRSVSQDLLSISYENAATFILSNENILCISDEPFVSLDPLNSECMEIKLGEKNLSSKESNEKDQEEINDQCDLFWTDSNNPDAKMEMAVVDEIIKNTALELDQWESDTSRSEISSDGTSGSESSIKEKEEETDDPDWKPDFADFSERKCGKRPKSYWRGGSQEEKKLRKKEQNKNAATRYRLKKKAEICEILKEEELLKEKKAKLEEKITDIQSEIKYLKALMRDLFKAKGIIN